jgi:hypothetical protein
MSNRLLSYKGLLTNDQQDTIRLSTKKGEKGYRITKFQLMPATPGANINSVVKVTKNSIAVGDYTIDFSDNRLLAVGWNYNATYETDLIISFDNEIFNQDIFISQNEHTSGLSINYYLELEVIMLNETEATVATLKDIRNNQ